MSTSVTLEPKQDPKVTKRPSTRLLDLLAGWSNYVSIDEENNMPDATLRADDIAGLYQFAGNLIESWDELQPDDEDSMVTSFVEERVLPLLLRHLR